MTTVVEAVLWTVVGQQARNFDTTISHNSDLFTLVACALAYYKVRGTPPEQMISDTMHKQINFIVEQAELEAKRLAVDKA